MIHENTSIGAVTLKVADLDKMVAFYRDVIGLQVLENSQLDNPHKTITLGTPTRPLVHLRHLPSGRRVPKQSGLYHLALRVSNRTAFANWFRYYASLNAPGWQGGTDHGASNALYFSDPEGNGVEVYSDLPREQWPYDEHGKHAIVLERLDLQALLRDADETTFTAIDSATDMGHVHLSVSGIPSAKQFYVDLLGFELQVELPDSALFISAGGYHHHVGLNVWQSRGGANNSADSLGLDRFEICFDSVESREQTLNRLSANHNTIEMINNVATVIDPFQNSIDLRILSN